MPVGLPNATPGPSGMGRNTSARDSGGNHGVVLGRSNVLRKESKDVKERERQKALKRPSSEEALDAEERERKKTKVIEGAEDLDDDDVINARDSREKKRRRRRKKKKSIAAVVVAGTSQRSLQEVALTLNSSSETMVSYGHEVAIVEDEVTEVKADDDADDDADDEAPSYSSSDKGKGRAKHGLPPQKNENSNLNLNDESLASGNPSSADTHPGLDQSSEIARLKTQLAEQRSLLERHQSHLNQQQQILTCQVCLELMHKPYALTPCGHVTCYGCLVRWFTSDPHAQEPLPNERQENENEDTSGDDLTALLNSAIARQGKFVRRRKTCPVCRGVVHDRPVEMWDIKKMVVALVKSHLVDLPLHPGSMVGEENSNGHRRADGNNRPNDPWRNVFKPGGLQQGRRRLFRPPAPGYENDENVREHFGWYDNEDGGVYRCIDCFHEIWGGECSGCRREYIGHQFAEDDEEEDEDGDVDVFVDFWLGDREDEDDYPEDDGFIVPDEGAPHFMGEWNVGGRDTDVEGDTDVESSDGLIDEEASMLRRMYDTESDGEGGRDLWRANLRSDSEGSGTSLDLSEGEEGITTRRRNEDLATSFHDGLDIIVDIETGLRRSTRRRAVRPYVESEAYDSDDSEDIPRLRPVARTLESSRRSERLRSRRTVDSAEDDDSDS